ncbi:MAG TPA: YHS domain-containing (seleno)protein [Flavitalea sp.]|nr:YHS domain-containing (seleno)protein [Flavitalea sp.]
MKGFALICVLQIAVFAVVAQFPVQQRLTQYNLEKNEPAIQGYDPVSYFMTGRPIKGRKEYGYSFQGILYRFSSQGNLNAFNKDPSKYEPQYGGWCAYAMGNDGSKVDVDPETFKVIDGKLYLFYNAFFNNTLKTWNKDQAALKKKADQNWQKYYHP